MIWYTGVCCVGRSPVDAEIVAAEGGSRGVRYKREEGMDVYRAASG